MIASSVSLRKAQQTKTALAKKICHYEQAVTTKTTNAQPNVPTSQIANASPFFSRYLERVPATPSTATCTEQTSEIHL